jgi:hypothetical protein
VLPREIRWHFIGGLQSSEFSSLAVYSFSFRFLSLPLSVLVLEDGWVGMGVRSREFCTSRVFFVVEGGSPR